MPDPPLAALVMAGGLGTRMRSAVPKHFHEILGRRMVDWVIETGRELGADPLVVVASPSGARRVRGPTGSSSPSRNSRSAPATPSVRPTARCRGYDGDVLVLSGDTPLLTPELLAALVETHRSERAAATILSASPADPRVYGRIVRGADGAVLRIAEGTDATPEELEHPRDQLVDLRVPRGRALAGARAACSRRTSRASCT